MINLRGTTDTLELVTSAAVTVDVMISWVDYVDAATTASPNRTATAITTGTTTTILAAAGGATTTRNAKTINIRNKHASSSNTVTVNQNISSALYQLAKATLLAGETLTFVEGVGWRVYDANGQPKVGSLAINPMTNTFRLTGVTGTPVMTADSSSLSTIYLAQYTGNAISLYDGANWQLLAPAAEPSLAVTGRTTDLPFDIFAYSNAGTVTLEFLDWTNSTTRATGLTRVDGVWTKTGDPTRRYLGSCRARSATTFHWVLSGDGASGPTKIDLFNADNRKSFGYVHKETTDVWTYQTATIRQARGSTNNQVDIMVGLQEEFFDAVLTVTSRNATISIAREVGIGYDTTSAFTGIGASTNNTVTAVNCCQVARLRNQPTIGRHFYSWNEISTATGTCTWCGDDGGTRIQSGMSGEWTC